MSENEPYEFYHTSTIDLNDPALKLRGLASTAKMLPLEYLNSWLTDFIEMEKYEESAIIRDEIQCRESKYKLYLIEPDGKQTEVFGVKGFPL